MRSYIITASALAAFANAQTWTLCNPMEKDCENNPAIAENFESNFKDGESALKGWQQTAKGTEFTDAGAVFSVKQKGDAPTIQSDGYLHFGYVEVTMKAASGSGIVSSIVLESDDLDEVDWEFIGSETNKAQMNYFGKGNTTVYDRMLKADVPNIEEVHRYALNWTADALTWIIDDAPVRTLKYEEANGGKNFPQTPCNVRIGIWAGGDSEDQGTQDWAGGKVDYSKAPFNQVVEKVKIINYSPGKEYEWTDKSGSWESIKVIDGEGVSSGGSSEPSPSATDKADDSAATSTPCSDEVVSTPPPEETPCDCDVVTVTVTGPPPESETPPPETTPPPAETSDSPPPVSTSCTDSTPVESTTVESTPPPAESTPVESTPVESTPVESTPVESTPVESTPPAESTPVESTPVESTPPPAESTPPPAESTPPPAESTPCSESSDIPPESTPPPAETTPAPETSTSAPPTETPCTTTEVPPAPPVVETPKDNCTTLVTATLPPYPTGGIIVETSPPPSVPYPTNPTGAIPSPPNGTSPPIQEFPGAASTNAVSYVLAVAAGLMVFVL
ncbi:hypothetical protein N0V90_004819 [Kalmusia sp. IMI 367209]|nr:hypothetical protein N0V90_004819 [Kalmusia sp. IMI 367209]